MNLLGSLTVKPLLILVAILVVMLGLQEVRVTIIKAQRDVATAAGKSTVAERDAYKQRADELTAANVASSGVIERLKAELNRAQGDCEQVQTAGEKAAGHARLDAKEAARIQQIYVGRYAQQVREPACAHALSSLEQACPALAGY